ncbi:MAG: CPBP family intramembrane metalloprotease [Simkaniaceae bacterium]|nr:CPBP family intramembrane metalloprotease [Simkaniaceae bacterium]
METKLSIEDRDIAWRHIALAGSLFGIACISSPAFFAGAVAYAAYTPVSLAMFYFSELSNTEDKQLPAPRPATVILKGGIEEIVFRAPLLLVPHPATAIISILSFTVMHYPKFGTIARIIPVALSAIMYTALLFTYGLPAAIAAHTLHNLVHQTALTAFLTHNPERTIITS